MTKLLLFILLAMVTIGCECVPGLDAPKEITPENSTQCLFINGVEDNENIYLETDEIKILGAINYSKTIFDFKKVKIGNYFLKIKANDSVSVIYNSPFNFKKDKRYILCAAGINYSIQTLLIEQDYSNQNYTEIINLSGEPNPLEITIISGTDTLKYSLNQLTSIKLDINNAKIDMLYIKNNNSELELNEKDIQLLNYNLLIIKGKNYINRRNLILDAVSSN